MRRSFLQLSTNNIANRATKRWFSSIKRPGDWESIIGLEVHAQISTESKLFSGGATAFGAPLNSLVTFFDAAIPGTLPVLNKKCVEAAVLTAMALSCEINPVSWFDRKHYFYSDLPSGFQITQQRKAIANKGELQFVVYNPSIHKQPYYAKSKIQQLQLEQDSGRSLHVPSGNRSLIDLNRAGIALMEIVFEPDLKDGEEASALVKELCLILERIGTCSCRMEEGALRVDANISVNRKGLPLGTRTEVKNISSIRSIVNAIEFEVERQISELEKGRRIVNETRGYDAQTKQTVPMRDKEERQDYRFMPEPNLPPLKVTYDPGSTDSKTVNIAKLRSRLKELPEVTRKRLMKQFGLKLETAIMIVNTPGFLPYFQSVMKNIDSNLGLRTANFIAVEILSELNKNNLTLNDCMIDPDKLGELIKILDDQTVNFIKATEIMQLLLKGDNRSPLQIVKDENWMQVTDSGAIMSACEDVLKENPNLVMKFKNSGKSKLMNQLIAKVKTKTGGKYNMQQVADTVEKLLKNS